MTGAQIGAIVGIAFGCAWGIAGTLSFAPIWRVVGVFGSIVVSTVLVMLALHRSLASSANFYGTIYGVAVTCEVIAIAAFAAILKHYGRESFIPPAVSRRSLVSILSVCG